MTVPSRPSRKKAAFEDRVAELEALIERLEAGTLTLEESLQAYENGMSLLSDLKKELSSAEQRLTILSTDEEGCDVEIDLDLPDEDNAEDEP